MVMTNLVEKYREMKKRGEKITALTAYDYPTARLLEEMLHHTRAVARGVKSALVVGDMPIHTFETPEQAVATAKQFVDAGAQALKLEGGVSHAAHIEAITDAGIPYMAH